MIMMDHEHEMSTTTASDGTAKIDHDDDEIKADFDSATSPDPVDPVSQSDQLQSESDPVEGSAPLAVSEDQAAAAVDKDILTETAAAAEEQSCTPTLNEMVSITQQPPQNVNDTGGETSTKASESAPAPTNGENQETLASESNLQSIKSDTVKDLNDSDNDKLESISDESEAEAEAEQEANKEDEGEEGEILEEGEIEDDDEDEEQDHQRDQLNRDKDERYQNQSMHYTHNKPNQAASQYNSTPSIRTPNPYYYSAPGASRAGAGAALQSQQQQSRTSQNTNDSSRGRRSPPQSSKADRKRSTDSSENESGSSQNKRPRRTSESKTSDNRRRNRSPSAESDRGTPEVSEAKVMEEAMDLLEKDLRKAGAFGDLLEGLPPSKRKEMLEMMLKSNPTIMGKMKLLLDKVRKEKQQRNSWSGRSRRRSRSRSASRSRSRSRSPVKDNSNKFDSKLSTNGFGLPPNMQQMLSGPPPTTAPPSVMSYTADGRPLYPPPTSGAGIMPINQMGSLAPPPNSGSFGMHPMGGGGEPNQNTFQSNPNINTRLCKYFIDSKCYRGNDCPFSHDLTQHRKRDLCKYYLQGFCGKAESCLFMHHEFPCKFFHTKVECYGGNKCRFSHAPLTDESREILRRYLDSGTLPDDPPEMRKAMMSNRGFPTNQSGPPGGFGYQQQNQQYQQYPAYDDQQSNPQIPAELKLSPKASQGDGSPKTSTSPTPTSEAAIKSESGGDVKKESGEEATGAVAEDGSAKVSSESSAIMGGVPPPCVFNPQPNQQQSHNNPYQGHYGQYNNNQNHYGGNYQNQNQHNNHQQQQQQQSFQPQQQQAKRHNVLGDPTEDMKTSYSTWQWQQDMKELEVAYTGNKRNLWCIESQFVIPRKPPTPQPEDQEEAEMAEFIVQAEAQRKLWEATAPTPSFFVDKFSGNDSGPSIDELMKTEDAIDMDDDEYERLMQAAAKDEDLRHLGGGVNLSAPSSVFGLDPFEPPVSEPSPPSYPPPTHSSISRTPPPREDFQPPQPPTHFNPAQALKEESVPQNLPKVARDLFQKLQSTSSTQSADNQLLHSTHGVKKERGNSTDDEDEGDEALMRRLRAMKQAQGFTPISTSNPGVPDMKPAAAAPSATSSLDISKILSMIRSTPTVSGATGSTTNSVTGGGSPGQAAWSMFSAAATGAAAPPPPTQDPRLASHGGSHGRSQDPRLKRTSSESNDSTHGSQNPLESAMSPRHHGSVKDPRHHGGHSPTKRKSSDLSKPATAVLGTGKYRLFPVDLSPVDYTPYSNLYRNDTKMKNDPRLQKFFGKISPSPLDSLLPGSGP